MKYLITLSLICCSLCCIANPAVYRKLVAVNQFWSAQNDIQAVLPETVQPLSEKEWIRLHLNLVEQTLRNRSAQSLSPRQRQLRSDALDHLHQYWLAGNFPLNERYRDRMPIFIDRHDNFCAVGYLVKATGYEQVSRMIASRSNLAYVMDMQYPELDQWAREYGFTKEELAWIQPTYPPLHYTGAIGGGTNGQVKELFAGAAGEKLYVGGSFTQVDGGMAAGNIAYVTKDNTGAYSWHSLGDGTNGVVKAIAEYNGRLFAGGSFSMAGTESVTNIAYWENNSWHGAGCLYGTVADLVVFNGELYAVGDFDVCAAMSEVNFARWNGTTWSQIMGLEGKVNTAEVMGDRLLLGGDMTYQNDKANAIAWRPENGFQRFDNTIFNPVNDFELFKGKMYAACDMPLLSSNNVILLELDNNIWKPLYEEELDPFMPLNDKRSMNSLLTEGNTLMAGGSFRSADMMFSITNCSDITPAPYHPLSRYFYTDEAIHKLILFKGDFIAGGDFTAGMTPTGNPIPVGGIARRVSPASNIPGPDATAGFRIYPNPATGNTLLTIEGNTGAAQLLVYDLSGRVVFKTGLQAAKQIQQVQLPALAPALYMAELSSTGGAKTTKKLLLH